MQKRERRDCQHATDRGTFDVRERGERLPRQERQKERRPMLHERKRDVSQQCDFERDERLPRLESEREEANVAQEKQT